MKKTFKRILTGLMAVLMFVAFSVTAFAAEKKLSREEVVKALWTDWAEQYSNEDNNFYDIDNPRTSLDYYILNEWLDKYYGKEKAYENAEESCDWTDKSSIEKSYWAYYYAQLEKHNVYISSEDAGEPINFYSNDTGKVIYTFSRSGQTWHILDKNKNVLFSFPVRIPEKAETKAPTWNNNGGYETDEDDSSEMEAATTAPENNENEEDMTGVTPYAWNSEVQSAGNNSAEADNESDKSAETKKMTESKSEKKEKSDSASYILYIGIAAIVAAVVIVAVKYKKKK